MAHPPADSSPLAAQLDRRTAEGVLYERLPESAVRCVACGHRCLIRDGRRGICKVRYNEGGTLYVPRNYVAALQCDPVEKKPFNHVLPGSNALTFGMLGCDLHCPSCQNWVTSQALRDPDAGAAPIDLSAEQLVDYAGRCGARLVVSSYNEPLITSEWAVEVFRVARPRGLLTGFVSNGNATPEALDFVRPHADCYKIDLKTMSDRNYRRLGATLERVLDSIRLVHERGLWLEVVTLVIPGFSDDEGQLRDAAAFIASVSPDIPWHVTAFHEDYKFYGMGGTSAAMLVRACEIGRAAGLRFVYAGNLPGRVGRWEDTHCPGCDAALVERTGYRITTNRLGADGRCPSCGTAVPGIWAPPPAAAPNGARAGRGERAAPARRPRT